MKNFVFGKYIPIDSYIHRLDPRTKIISLFLMIIIIFIPNNWTSYLILFALILIEVLIAKLSFSFILKAMKPTVFMLVFLLIINCLSIKTGKPLFQIGGFVVYVNAILQTLFIVTRLLLMIMVTTTLTASTKPLDLTLGIEHLLSPLKIFHFPAHEVAMMISIALRFIPTIIEETIRIMNAQKSRGVDFEEGKLKEKLNAILSLIIPLFSVAFERAYELADAMEARGYVPGAKRTRYRQLKYQIGDLVYILLTLLLLILIIYLRYLYAL